MNDLDNEELLKYVVKLHDNISKTLRTVSEPTVMHIIKGSIEVLNNNTNKISYLIKAFDVIVRDNNTFGIKQNLLNKEISKKIMVMIDKNILYDTISYFLAPNNFFSCCL